MRNTKELIQENLDNNRIITEIFANKIIEARKKKYPSAEDIVGELL